MVELLAPAGSKEALIAAVESGADAVYLAGNQFGARAYADNFDRDGLREAIRYAHLRHVAVHVTVNTIVGDEELSELASYFRFLYEAGADAVLVQDLGAARLAMETVPGLPLHASTQMTVHNLEGVIALEEMGFSRVVLSRELSLAEIRHICAHAKAEIEVFLHGALCICYSGQCLMSSLIGGRSGNRGRCAQPCRLPYQLVDSAGRNLLEGKAGEYLLSPKDLNGIDFLPSLIDAGVRSLKIEGRMKRPEYVAIVVDAYRRAIQHYERCQSSKNGESYQPPKDAPRRLGQIFNRDFTAAYWDGIPGRRMMSDKKPNNRGRLTGRITTYDHSSRRASMKLSESLAIKDQVDIWVKVGGRVATTISSLWDKNGKAISEGHISEEVSFEVPAPVHPHDRVFKVRDAKLMDEAKRFYATGSPLRRVPVCAEVSVALGQPLMLRLTDAEGNRGEASTAFRAEEAKNRPLTQDTLEKQLGRLGTSIFSLEKLEAKLPAHLMVPVSEINEVRRKAVAALEDARLLPYRRQPLPKTSLANAPAAQKKRISSPSRKRMEPTAPLELSVAVDSIPMLEAAIKAGADALLFGGESYRHQILSPDCYRKAAELAQRAGTRIFFHTPRIVRDREQTALESILDAAAACRPDGVYVHNIGTLHLVRRQTQLPIYGDFSLITANRQTLEFLKEYGVLGATLSPELSWAQVAALAKESPLPLECIVHGRLELMVSSYCAAGSFLGGLGDGPCSQPCKEGPYALRDRKQAIFPLAMDQFCRMHVLNSKILSMLPYTPDFAPAGIRRIRIEGRAMEEAELSAVIRAYQTFKTCRPEDMERHRERIRALEGNSCTRGHYFRGAFQSTEFH